MEIWKDVKGWEGFYQISNLGNVKSLYRTGISKKGIIYPVKERLLSACLDSDGYSVVVFSRGSIHYNKKIHRLVACAFLKNPQNKRTVNHINGVKNDNRLENLEWATDTENHNHSYKYLGRKGGNKGRFGALNPSSQPVIAFFKDGSQKIYAGQTEAARNLGVTQSAVYKVLAGKLNHARGIKFKRVSETKHQLVTQQ